jgi:hypothetical protein
MFNYVISFYDEISSPIKMEGIIILAKLIQNFDIDYVNQSEVLVQEGTIKPADNTKCILKLRK